MNTKICRERCVCMTSEECARCAWYKDAIEEIQTRFGRGPRDAFREAYEMHLAEHRRDEDRERPMDTEVYVCDAERLGSRLGPSDAP